MKKYLTLIFIILFASTFSFFEQVFADQINTLTINSASAILSNHGYISSAGKENIIVGGIAPSGSTVTVVLSDSANPSNSVSNTRIIPAGVTSYRVGLNSMLAYPEPLSDGLINISAYITASSSVLATTTIIKETIAPTIIILGDNPFKCRVRSSCPDLGAVAFDSFGNKLNVTSSSNVRTNTEGNYIIFYNTVDFAGNEATFTRRVSVSSRMSGLSSTTIDTIPTFGLTQASATFSAPVLIQNTAIDQSTSTEEVVITQISTTTQVYIDIEVPVTIINVSGITNTVRRQLFYGISGADVKLIQTVLSHDTSVYPEGLTTGYFGPLTRSAVQRFQVKYNIASAGIPGYGQVGPKTRAKLIEIYGE